MSKRSLGPKTNPAKKFRDNHSRLPKKGEIEHIVSLEQQRPKHPEKINKIFVDFSSIITLLDNLGIRSDIFKVANLPPDDIFEIGEKITKDFIHKVHLGLSEKTINLLDNAYDYLAEQDEPQKVDLIFVFGAPSNLRAKAAVNLFKEGFGRKIVFTGRGPHYMQEKSAKTEAQKHADYAMDNGVPRSNIIIEDSSITIPDNIRATLNLFDEKNIAFKSIILVNSPYSQRRGWVSFQKYVPSTTRIYRVNSEVSEGFSKSFWYKNEDGVRVILSEFLKMKNALNFNDA